MNTAMTDAYDCPLLWQSAMEAGNPPCPIREMIAAVIRALLTAELDPP